MYRPLPDEVTIKKSTIHGLGLFAVKDIKEGKCLGITHIKYDSELFEHGYIRTPLGAFINHSNDNNVRLQSSEDGRLLWLYAVNDIKIKQELKTKYTLYNVQ